MDNKSYFESLPKKPMGAGAVIRNQRGEVLIVKPTYKDTWEIPGGVVEADESPLSGCLRELREELGFDIALTHLVFVDYVSGDSQLGDRLQFIFASKLFLDEDVESITLPKDELEEFRFVSREVAQTLLGSRLGKRMNMALSLVDSGHTYYLENSCYVNLSP